MIGLTSCCKGLISCSCESILDMVIWNYSSTLLPRDCMASRAGSVEGGGWGAVVAIKTESETGKEGSGDFLLDR